MKTIKERAEESANRVTIHLLSDSWYIHRYGYIKGATEQKSIDIDNACEWWMRELNDTDYGYFDMDMINDFRKAMEK